MKHIILITLLGLSSYSLHAEQAVNAGKTIVSLGSVNANSSTKSRALKRRSPVYTNEKIVTGQQSSAQIRMVDGGLLSLQQDSELDIVDYQFDQQQDNGQVRLKLIKGGLRTVTGALTASAKKYQMQTPVASIGVRGTHYEAELVDGNLFLAVWDGDIDVNVEVGERPSSFSLGNNEDFSFASVQPSGEVKLMLDVPSVFSEGHSSQAKAKEDSKDEADSGDGEEASKDKQDSSGDNKEQNADQKQTEAPAEGALVAEESGSQAPATENVAMVDNANVEFTELFSNDEQVDLSTITSISENIINKDLLDLTPTSLEVIAERTGVVSFEHLEDLGSVSSGGEVIDMKMAMDVNFTTQIIPGGELSFVDDGGKWFAAFDGVIGKQGLELNVNSASYNHKQVVEGSIHGVFVKDATKVLGGFSLKGRDDASLNASGDFLISEASK